MLHRHGCSQLDIAHLNDSLAVAPRSVDEAVLARACRVTRTAVEQPFPAAGLAALHEADLLLAPFPAALGGADLAVGRPSALVVLLRAIGRADLKLGCLYEGHVNAVALAIRYGSLANLAGLRAEAIAGRIGGVWMAGEPLRLERGTTGGSTLAGRKILCSGSGFIRRPLVAADFEGGSIMLLPRMEDASRVDLSGWTVRGMLGSATGTVDFSGIVVDPADLLGKPGDYLRSPRTLRMKASAFLAAAEALPFGTLRDILGGGGLVVVAPQPDDESLGCGGVIAEACASGIAVHLVVVSDGADSHLNSRRWPPPALRDLREQETRQAAHALGLDAGAIRFLRLPDRFVPSHEPAASAAATAIARAAREVEAGAICVTWRHDPHCDHRAAAAIVVRFVRWYPGCACWPIRSGAGPCRPITKSRDFTAAGAWTSLVTARRNVRPWPRIARWLTDLIDDRPDGFRLTLEIIAHLDRSYEVLLEDP